MKTRLFTTLLCTLACSGAMAQAGNGKPSSSESAIDYSKSPSTVLISYSVASQLIPQEAYIPRIQVFGDGMVWIHYPEYMQKAGDYSLQLSQGELMQLLKEMAGPVKGFDKDKAKGRKNQIAAQRQQATGLLEYRSDEVTETFTLDIQRFKAPGQAKAERLDKSVGWGNLKHEAKKYPEISELAALAGARENLLALLERDDLQRISR